MWIRYRALFHVVNRLSDAPGKACWENQSFVKLSEDLLKCV